MFPNLRRFLIACTSLLLLMGGRANAIDAAVVMNEIHYHPLAGDTEWIELHSLTGVDIDLSGWRLADGVDYTFPEGSKIAGHGYLIIAAVPGASSLAGLNPLGPWSGALNNAGEKVSLLNRDGREMDAVNYSDGGDWPVGADGSGATLARRNGESADPSTGSWAASADSGGTPGRANFAVSGQGPTVTTASDLNATWKYFVGAAPAGWEQPAFDDSLWSSGASLFYYGSPTLAGGSDSLLGYWPLDSITSAQTANVAPGGSPATVTGGPTIVSDATRGNVIQFTGTGQRVNAGSAIIPVMTLTNDFTWAFWANSAVGANNNIIVGNRYSTTAGVGWSPLEFIKFTTSQFEFYHNNAQNGIDYTDIAANSGWIHHAVVKSGSTLSYYRNGSLSGTTTMVSPVFNHPQSLYFGGEQTDEYWNGKLDDVAIWNKALTGAQVAALAGNTVNPLNATAVGTLRTPLAGATTYAFRRAFTFTGTPSRTTATLKLLVEDGCTVWLNGTQVYSQNNPPTSGVGTANVSADIAIPTSSLVKGNNVIAVQVATFASDPDMVFGATLTLSETAPTPADQTPGLVFNEISAGGAGFQLELTNQSGSAIDLTGYTLRSSTGASYTLSGNLNPSAFLALSAAQIGFTPVSGDKLFLFKSGGVALLDARQVTNRLRGLSTQFPGRWLYPASATFGSANAFTFNTDIVINEVMYKPRPLTQTPFVEDPEQWIELYNRGAGSVTLTGWSFGNGIGFSFPAGTTIPAGGYLVVSNNASALQSKWPAVASKIIGNFSGSIKHGGETLQLVDASGNPVNEVSFANDAPWPAAGGTGSSMELRDPRADNSRPEAWAASNEAYRGSWQTYSFTAAAAQAISNDPTAWNEFVFGLLNAGSVMIDDISVTQGGTQLIKNGTFETDTSGWRFLGDHSRASRITDPFGTGNVLRVDATDACEHMHNHCETMLQSGGVEHTINSALTYTISFRARWVSGSNLLNTRLYFDRMAHTTVLPVAPGGGTPGAPNTAFVANLGPTFTGLTHTPAVPAASQAATVSVMASDPDGMGAVTLFYSVNGAAFTSVAMSNLGAGKYTGTIPGQAAGAKVQFYVRAADGLGAFGYAPPLGASSRAIIPWDDGQARLTLNGVQPNNVRVVMTDADITTLFTVTNVMSNDRLPCTVIWNERDVYYDCGIHLHGSERGRDQPTRVSFNVAFPADKPALGIHGGIVMDRSGAGNQTSQKEILIKRAITHAGGIPGSEDDLCRVIAPQSAYTGPAILGRQRVISNDYLDSAYPSGSAGDLHKFEIIYYPTTTTGVSGSRGNAENLKYPEPDNVAQTSMTSQGSDKEAYRWHWLIYNLNDADDYSPLMTWLAAFGRTADAQYFSDTNTLMDVSEWLRSAAVETLFGIGDTYITGGTFHNAFFYRRPDTSKWTLLPYDMDFTFNLGSTSTMFPNSDMNKLVGNAGNLRTYWAHVYDICQTSFSSSYLLPWAQHYNNFVAEDLTQWMSYIDTRRSYALGQLGSAVPTVAYAITTPNNTSSPGPTVTINGNGWVDIAQLRLSGSPVPLAVTWVTTTAWQVSLPVAQGANPFAINAYNAQGTLLGTASVNIIGTGPAVPADASNLVISEIMYNPGAPTAAEQLAGFTDNDAFEYIELQNISATNPVTLAGCQFTAGITFALPSVTLAPGARALIVGDQAAFAQRYGSGFTILGEYQPASKLSNSGDHITLLDAHGLVIRDFSYSDSPPWPTAPDGAGYSLVLIKPTSNPDHSVAANWRASTAINGNPGVSDATTFTGNPTADDDQNGIPNFLQYALGASSQAQMPAGAVTGGYLTLTFRRNLAADDVTYIVERSSTLDPGSWSSAGTDVVFVSETHNADATATSVWRSAYPAGGTNGKEFLRLRLVKP
jgi:hypothetical protein